MIHCLRGRMPNFPPDPGRERIALKGWIVEYSGPVPTEADVDAFLAPPDPTTTRLTPEDIERLLIVAGLTRGQIEQAKRDRGKPL